MFVLFQIKVHFFKNVSMSSFNWQVVTVNSQQIMKVLLWIRHRFSLPPLSHNEPENTILVQVYLLQTLYKALHKQNWLHPYFPYTSTVNWGMNRYFCEVSTYIIWLIKYKYFLNVKLSSLRVYQVMKTKILQG